MRCAPYLYHFPHPHNTAYSYYCGTYIGTAASIVPLTLAAIPFVARLVETV